ncbi:ribosomal-protein-alanine N-acetyltransferase [Kitasatospora sp. GP30]|uniref:GNAT family N-acetyltransferase n=1 Tax=Kitasatospora sp. GP30 TaxID=3035084 RepID=UPI000C70C677|nr:GNAT family protein [Kitasatospora sp. GP30]MDH6143615.1 ribosomal-protein-alanine N-acetyltransferase [Kitasatospora sp. GP30]
MTSHYLLHGDRVAIRSLRRDDRDEFTRLAQENAERHHPWLAPPRTDAEFDAYMTRLEEPVRAGFAICLPDTGAMVGYVSVNNIVQGAFRCGALGYGAFAHGRGLVTEGVGLAVRHAFGPLGLHRLEINAQPANTKSITVAKRLGFRLEGLSPDFLFIDGAWRDHERWAITAEMLEAA